MLLKLPNNTQNISLSHTNKSNAIPATFLIHDLITKLALHFHSVEVAKNSYSKLHFMVSNV